MNNNGLLDLSIFENAKEDDLFDLPINESSDISITIPSNKEITADTYNKALTQLKRSFSEAVDIIDILSKSKLVDGDTNDIQENLLDMKI